MSSARNVSISLFILIFGIPSANAAPSSAGGTCRIEVTTFRKSKKSSRRTFTIPAESAEHCRAAAKLHEENFNPKHITQVKVKSAFTPAREGR